MVARATGGADGTRDDEEARVGEVEAGTR